MKRNIRRLGFLLFLLPVFVSCNPETVPESATGEFFAMDTVIRITVYGDRAEEAVKEVKEYVLACEEWFSVTNPDSEVSKLNQNPGKPLEVRDELAEQLQMAQTLSKRSGGAFDVTVYPIMEAWGYYDGNDEYRVPSSEELEEALRSVDYNNVDIQGNVVSLKNGSRIDLGGIAKGFVGSSIKDRLRKMGVESAILSLGGNVQTIGSKEGNDGKWTVGVADPDDPDELLGTVRCGETAVVTSGSYQRYFEQDGVTYHHIMDPKTGFPVDNGLSSVTVLCEDGMEADGLSTALFVLGKEEALKYYNRYQGFEAVFVTKGDEVILTKGLQGGFELAEGKKDKRILIMDAEAGNKGG